MTHPYPARCGSALLVAVFCLGLLLPLPILAGNDDLPPDLPPEVARLLDLITHRALLMPEVARYKWQRGLPVTDPAREAQVLDRASQEAMAAGIDAAGAEAFVSAQMRIARQVQEARMADFEQAAPADGGPDLDGALRPAISATTAAILDTLPRVMPLLAEQQASVQRALHRRLSPLGVDDAAIAQLAEALAGVSYAPPAGTSLQRVLNHGVLRVGTTLDYPPFSFEDAAGEPDGIDVRLGRQLAASLGVEVAFVQTSWPTLMEDLAAGRYDIGMSGISRNTDRARVAEFSAPYHRDGKTPIIRCADRDRFAGLDSIDQPGVRVVVNPGGTNEVFTRANVEQAEIRVFDDNRFIFREIIEDRADVMFTDAIEVELQTALDDRLCAALPGETLTFQEKGFMLPRDSDAALLRYVDLWLAELRGAGKLAALFEEYLSAEPWSP